MSAISTDQVQAEIKAAYASCFASDATGNRLFEKWLQERDRVILATPLGQTPKFDIESSGNEVKSAYTRNFHPYHNGFKINDSATQLELSQRFHQWLTERDEQVRQTKATDRG